MGTNMTMNRAFPPSPPSDPDLLSSITTTTPPPPTTTTATTTSSSSPPSSNRPIAPNLPQLAQPGITGSSPILAAAQAAAMNTPTTRAAAAATAIRKARVPPRNDAGTLYCEHPECDGFELTFRRMCEWHKHMDRHERPYKCFAYGCELTPGFTYSGGLLRHQREVHKMNLSAKQPLFCPFPSCNRNRDSENGFTRRENLEEHKRRRHMSELLEEVALKESPKSSYSPGPPTATAAVTPMRRRREEEVLPSPSSSTSSLSAAAEAGATAVAAVSSSLARLHQTSAPALKRRRTDTSTTTTTTDDPQRVQHLLYQSGLNEHQLIHLLQCRLREREDMIRAQAAELCRYQSLFHSLPHQAVYGVGGEQATQAPQQLPGGADSTAFARVADTKEPRV